MDLLSFHTPDRAILSFFAVLVVIAVGPWLAERFRLPGLLGLLFGGLLIGPYVLGIVQESDTFIKSLGTIGLLYLMYLAGLDLDLEILRRYKRIAITFAIITFIWPMALGFMTGELLGYKTAAAILLGSIWASHTLLTYPTFRRYGLANQRAVAVTVGATVITDTLALVVLALVSGYTTGDASGVVLFMQIMLGLVILAAYCFLALPRIVRRLMPSLGQPPTVRYIIALAALFSAVVVCEMFGIDGIVGAFFAGLALNPLIPKSGPLFEHIEFFGSALFIPMFLVSVGLIIEPSVMVDPKTLGTAAVFALSCIGGKLIAAMLCRPVFKYSWNEVGAVFALSVNQAAATLAATFVGYEIGLFGTTVVNAVLIVIVISVILGSVSAARYAPRLPVPPIDTSRLGRRVMVVVGDGPRDDAASVAATDVGSWMAKADGGHLVPLLVQLAWEGSVDDARIEAINESLAGRGFDTEVVVRVDRSRVDAVASAAVGQSATLAVVPAEPPGLDTAVFGAQEDRLIAQMPIPTVITMLKRTPTRFVLALSERDQRRASRNVQVVFEVAARLAKAGHPVSVYSASPLSPEQLSHLGGAEAVHGDDDRAAFLEANIDEHTAVIVPAPGGTSVFGHDIPSLAELGAGLLIAVGSEDDEADTVTIGHNLAAGRPRAS
jgi:Kef-type K+ transport system membrane component KefB